MSETPCNRNHATCGSCPISPEFMPLRQAIAADAAVSKLCLEFPGLRQVVRATIERQAAEAAADEEVPDLTDAIILCAIERIPATAKHLAQKKSTQESPVVITSSLLN